MKRMQQFCSIGGGGNFEVFRPAGATCCTTLGDSSTPNITPSGAKVGDGAQKLKILIFFLANLAI